MPRHVLLPSGKRDLGEIYRYLARAWHDKASARAFVTRLREHSEKLASLPGTLGRLRPELGTELRTAPFKGYLLVFRYQEDEFRLIRVIHGHRDMPAQFPPEDT